MAFDPSNGRGLQASINVTPLVDVCLVILIIFMVVAPFLVQGHPVVLPRAADPDRLPEEDAALALSLERDGRLYLGDHLVEPGDAAEAIHRRLERAPGQPVRLKADSRLSYGAVKGLLQALQADGARQVVLVVQSQPPPAPAPLAHTGAPAPERRAP